MNPEVIQALMSLRQEDAEARTARIESRATAINQLAHFARLAESEQWQKIKLSLEEFMHDAMYQCTQADGAELLRCQGEVRGLGAFHDLFEYAQRNLEAAQNAVGEESTLR